MAATAPCRRMDPESLFRWGLPEISSRQIWLPLLWACSPSATASPMQTLAAPPWAFRS